MRKPLEIGPVIATRRLSLADGSPVTIELGMPYADGDNPDYLCPYRITGWGSGRVRGSFGVDPIQALTLAMQAIGTDLYSSDEYRSGSLRWFKPHDDLGLPVLPGLEDVLPKED